MGKSISLKSVPVLVEMATSNQDTVLWRLRKRGLLTLIIFLCSMIVQTAFLLVLPSSNRGNENPDYVEYYSPVAQNILSGRGMVDTSSKLETSYPPGFPVVLAGIFYIADSVGVERMTSILFFNILLMSLACVMVFWTAMITFDIRIALISAGLWITYPFNLWLLKQPNSEVPFIPLLYGTIYCTVCAIQRQSIKYVMASGFLLAMAAMVRPIALLLICVLACALLLNGTICRKKRFTYAAVLVGVYCLGLLPWETKVYVQTRQIIPLSTNGPSSMLDGLTYFKRSERGETPEPAAELMRRIWEHRRELRTTGEIVRYLMVSELKQNPRAFFELVG